MKYFLFTSFFLICIQGRVVIYLSPSGTNASTCGASPSSSCRNLAYAYSFGQGKGSTDKKDMFLVNGDYVETATLTVNGTLNIFGQSETGCRLKKTTGHACFMFVNNTILTVTSLTILVINDSNVYNFVRLQTTANITFISCHITRDLGSTSNRGSSFFFQSTASGEFRLSSCTVYDITGDQDGVFIETNTSMKLVRFQDTSFANMRHTGVEYYSSVFRLQGVTEIVIVRCLFVMCFANSSSVGSTIRSAKCTIESCTFWNNTASYSYGTVGFKSSNSFRANVSIVNTTCVSCVVQTYNGGCFHIDVNISARLERCAFTECFAGLAGSAVYVRNSSANVTSCHFFKCSTTYGGGTIYLEDRVTLRVTDSIFLDCNGVTRMSGTDLKYLDTLFTNSHCLSTASVFCQFDSSSYIGPNRTTISLTDACDSVFTDGNKSSCPQPCVSSSSSSSSSPSCLFLCPTDFVATSAGSVCVPGCSFIPPYFGECTGTCEVTDSTGFPLCADSQPCEPLESGGDSSHHVLVAGLCRLKVCGERTPVLSNSSSSSSDSGSLRYPCGGSSANGCYYDSAAGVCVESCFEDEHHTNVNKECTLKNCTARLYSSSSALPCGSSDCFYDPPAQAVAGQQCVAACPAVEDSFHAPGLSAVDGECVLKSCTARLYNSSSAFPCGSSDCFYDPASPATKGQQCVGTCPTDNLHTGNTEATGSTKCGMKSCSGRTPDESLALLYPCGGSSPNGCYYDSAAGVCVQSCIEDYQHTGAASNVSRECTLKNCTTRRYNSSSALPCGSSDCFYDPAARPEVGQQCVAACPTNGNLHTGGVADGECTLKACAERRANYTAQLPCGADCFEDVAGIDSKKSGICIETCTSTDYDSFLTLITGECISEAASPTSSIVIIIAVVVSVVVVVVIIVVIVGVVRCKRKKANVERNENRTLIDYDGIDYNNYNKSNSNGSQNLVETTPYGFMLFHSDSLEKQKNFCGETNRFNFDPKVIVGYAQECVCELPRLGERLGYKDGGDKAAQQIQSVLDRAGLSEKERSRQVVDTCVKLYTEIDYKERSDNMGFIYVEVNKCLRNAKSLRDDDIETLKEVVRDVCGSLASFTFLAWEGLGYFPALDKAVRFVYRGLNVPEASYHALCHAGEKYIVFPSFSSFSVDERTALTFPGSRPGPGTRDVLYQLEVWQRPLISDESAAPHEQEVLIHPFSLFKVLDVVEERGKRPMVKLCDIKALHEGWELPSKIESNE